ncbi:hypothetical protein [Streptomyces longispororuber]|uniref:hypothetical protein n=1 Tax=Streptomyces longispororuber TaxID=68230 RepID=UPI00210D4ED7|nr:hypothetical protein [Streptomyces longispororuber]MCQ4210120.1 hypothetical protein [Streptomyces longispororuber]
MTSTTSSGSGREGLCPVVMLLPQGPVNDAGAALAAARDRLAGLQPGGLRWTGIGQVLRHLFTHGYEERPPTAALIAELMPDVRAAAEAQLAGYHADWTTDPTARAWAPLGHTDHPEQGRTATLIALALLDPAAHGAAAREAFRTAGALAVGLCAAGYALLGPAERAEAVDRLRTVAATDPGGAALTLVRALLALGCDEETADVVRDLASRGVPVRLPADALAAAPARARAALADSALRDLLDDPDRNLADLDQTADDVVSEVLACGTDHHDQVRDALRTLVSDATRTPGLRRRAATRLALVSPDEEAAAHAYLGAVGVPDTRRPGP